MNKKLFIGGCGLAAIAGNVFAADEEYSYFTPCVALKGGYSLLGKRDDIKYKGGFAGAVEMGFSYDAWRAALELGYKQNKIKEAGGSLSGYEGTKWNLNKGIKLDAYATTAAHYNECSVYSAGVVNQPVYGDALHNWYFHDVTYFSIEKIKALTGMLNVCYDYAMTEAWSIYAGIGLGVAKVSFETRELRDTEHHATGNNAAFVANTFPAAAKTALVNALKALDTKDAVKTEHSKTVFAWQFMAGVGYELSENLKLTFGYKLFNTAKVKFGNAKIKTPFNHTAEAGFVLSF